MGQLKRYDYVIFDADMTLIEFNEDERRAFRAAFSRAGVSVGAEAIEACRRISDSNWAELGLNDVHLPEIQKEYHAIYRKHVSTLFALINKLYPLGARIKEAEETFLRVLCNPSHTVDGAEEIVRFLAKDYRICIATNGLSAMQTGRLTAFTPYLYRTFISEEMGCIKPNKAFFKIVLQSLGALPQACLMVGDSLSSDIAGARAAGIDCVWFNRFRKPRPAGLQITAEIERLAQLKELLR